MRDRGYSQLTNTSQQNQFFRIPDPDLTLQEYDLKCKNDGAIMVGFENPAQFKVAADFIQETSKNMEFCNFFVTLHFLPP